MTGIRRSDIREKVAGETILFAHVAAVFDSPPKGKPSDYSPDDFRWISEYVGLLHHLVDHAHPDPSFQ